MIIDIKVYTFPNGMTMKREDGETPNGNPMNGKWVLRDSNGKLIDFGKYRNDIAERNGLEL